jgi:Tol biopolymer transport system component
MLSANAPTKRLVDSGELTIVPPPEGGIPSMPPGRGSKPLPPIRKPAISMSGESSARVRRKKLEKARRVVGILSFAIVIFGGLAIYLLTSGSNLFASSSSTNTPPEVYTLTSPPTLGPTITIQAGDAPTQVPDVIPTETPTEVPSDIPTEEPTEEPTEAPSETPSSEPVETSTTEEAATQASLPSDIASRKIAFASDRNGEVPQIWLMSANGSEFTQVTNVEGGACHPEWSPDATRIAFISPCTENDYYYLDSSLYLINADGTEVTPLNTPPGSFDPAWSPDGESLLFTIAYDANRAQIFRLRLSDGSLELMTDNDKHNIHPAWSPTGNEIVFVSSLTGGLRLWIMPNDPGAEPSQFSRSGPMDNTFPSWSPDSQHIVFSQKPVDGGVNTLTRLDIDVPTTIYEYFETRIAEGALFVPEWDPDYSPDGALIAFESWPDGNNHDIYIILSEGSAERIRLTTDPANDFDPAWKPIIDTP